MKRRIMAGVTALLLVSGIMLHAVPDTIVSAEPYVKEIPNTEHIEKSFDTGFLSVTGYAENRVNDRSEYLNTEHHRVCYTELEFLTALDDAREGKVKIIEIREDLDLGYESLSEEARACKSIDEYGTPLATDLQNPAIGESGVSQLSISNTDGLTIFSPNGATVRRAEWKLQGTSKDIIIRNLRFDGMWQWSEAASTKEAGWSLMKVNGAKGVWLDHCSFTNAIDGNIDAENGANGISYTWCVIGPETTESPDQADAIYQSVTYMEYLYQKGNILDSNGRYSKLRRAGATVPQIMAYECHHKKVSLNGSGDKDYKDNEKLGLQDGNQGIRLTMAYNKVNNTGTRLPLLRQGTAHMFNMYVDHSEHMKMHEIPAFADNGKWNMSRLINPRNGGVVGADTCVFKGVTSVMHGEESQHANINETGFTRLFANCYNHLLIVNSRVINLDGTDYTGSSWDNNGENPFNGGSWEWTDKSTIGKWAWSSSIVGVENMQKENPPEEPFTFTYGYDEKLPYTYKTFPLEDVMDVVDTHAGAFTYKEDASFWVRTEYKENETFTPADKDAVVEVEYIDLNKENFRINYEDTAQVIAELKPSDASNRRVTFVSSDPNVVEVWDSGLMIPKNLGEATVTVTAENGISATCQVVVYEKVTAVKLKSRSKSMNVGATLTIPVTIEPFYASDYSVTWKSSDETVAKVDADGTIHGLKEGKVIITCTSVSDPECSATCQINVKAVATPDVTRSPEKKGDVNKDGIVNASDALLVLKHAAKLEMLKDDLLNIADINEDELIDANDALRILKVAAKLV